MEPVGLYPRSRARRYCRVPQSPGEQSCELAQHPQQDAWPAAQSPGEGVKTRPGPVMRWSGGVCVCPAAATRPPNSPRGAHRPGPAQQYLPLRRPGARPVRCWGAAPPCAPRHRRSRPASPGPAPDTGRGTRPGPAPPAAASPPTQARPRPRLPSRRRPPSPAAPRLAPPLSLFTNHRPEHAAPSANHAPRSDGLPTRLPQRHAPAPLGEDTPPRRYRPMGDGCVTGLRSAPWGM